MSLKLFTHKHESVSVCVLLCGKDNWIVQGNGQGDGRQFNKTKIAQDGISKSRESIAAGVKTELVTGCQQELGTQPISSIRGRVAYSYKTERMCYFSLQQKEPTER